MVVHRGFVLTSLESVHRGYHSKDARPGADARPHGGTLCGRHESPSAEGLCTVATESPSVHGGTLCGLHVSPSARAQCERLYVATVQSPSARTDGGGPILDGSSVVKVV